MYYYSKWLFFVVFYCISCALYYLIDKQFMLKGFTGSFFGGAAAVFAAVIAAAFTAALFLKVVAKGVCLLIYAVCKKQKKEIPPKMFWIIFTALSFILAFSVFLKVIQY